MWAKSVSLFCFTNVFIVLQVSYGKPTGNLSNHNISEFVETNGDVNASFLETVSVLLTVLARDDTTAEGIIANSTAEPDYDDDYNSTSSTLSELEEDDLDSLSMQFNGSTESSSPLSSLITDEMDVAGSLDESVIASARTLAREDHSDSISVTTSSSAEDDDSLIITGMGSSVNQATVQPPSLLSDPTETHQPTETFSGSSSSESSLPPSEMVSSSQSAILE